MASIGDLDGIRQKLGVALASSDPTFATSTVLSEMDAVGLPHRAIFAQEVSPPVQARYVRVAKTAPEYFFLGEVRVHARR